MKFIRPVAFFSVALSSLLFSASIASAITVASSTHPTLITHDFASEIPFAAYKREGGVASGARFSIDKGALKITNAYGGSFGIDTKIAAFDAEKHGHLFFDYLIPPTKDRNKSVKVNLFFRVKGIYHGVHFSGPEEVRAGSVFLGTLPKVVADGKWHRAHIPLRDWLRKIYPREDQLNVEEIIIGNWNSANFLMSGIGGNGEGATWKMDNFVISGIGPKDAKFTVEQKPGKPLTTPAEYSWSLDGGAVTALKTPEISMTAANGFHSLQIFDKAKKPVAAYGFFVALDAPQAGTPELVNHILQIPITTEAGLNLKTLKLGVGNKSFESDSPYLSWSGADGVLSLDAGRAGLSWKDGEQIPVSLEGAQDTLGRALPTVKAVVKVDFSKQKDVPKLHDFSPQLEALKGAGSGTFEESVDEWSSKADSEGAAIVERVSSAKATGKYSLRLTSPTNSATLGAWIRRTPFDVTKYPALEFDYRISADVRADLLLAIGGQTYSIAFTDRTPQFARIGQIADVKADEQWHHASVDLLAMLQKATPPITAQKIDWLALSDTGYLGNARGDQIWIDNFQMVSVVKGAPFTSRVLLSDVTGVKALSWVLDDIATTLPPATVKETGDVLNVTATGRHWLHLRAQNGAGQWSETSHWPLIFDAAPPVVAADAALLGGAKAAPSPFLISASDDAGLDLSSISLTMQGQKYSLRDSTMSEQILTLENKRLVFDFDRALKQGKMQPLTDGTPVAWSLKSVRDISGKKAPPLEGRWIYDLASDKTAPRCWPRSESHEANVENFNDGVPPASYDAPSRKFNDTVWTVENARFDVVRRDDAGDEKDEQGRKNLALRVTTTDAGCTVFRWGGSDLKTHPMVSFYYKFPPGINLALSVQSNYKTWYIAAAGQTPGAIAQIPDIVADNTWRWAHFNVQPLADKMDGAKSVYYGFMDAAQTTPPGVVWEIDDFTVQKVTPGEIDVAWSARDLSGIAKYRFAWDQNPDTNPTEETTESRRKLPAAEGTWWAHVQAQDKAGNWSKAAHLPIMQS